MAFFFELEDLASYLKQDLDTATAQRARTIAEGAITGYTGQLITEATYEHTLPVDRATLEVVMPQRPVTGVGAVEVGGVTLTEGTDYYWDYSPWLLLASAPDPWAPATVTYTAGYATVPPVVKAVALGVAGRAYTNPTGLRTEQVDDYSATYAGGGEDVASIGLLRAERDLLKPFRLRVGVVRV